MINLKELVDVTISTGSVNDQVGYGETISAIVDVIPNSGSNNYGTETEWSKLIYSLDELPSAIVDPTIPISVGLTNAVNMYFAKGGRALVVRRVRGSKTYDSEINGILRELKPNVINVLVLNSSEATSGYKFAIDAANTINEIHPNVVYDDKIVYYDMSKDEYEGLKNSIPEGEGLGVVDQTNAGRNVSGLVVHMRDGNEISYSAAAMAYVTNQRAIGTDTVKEYLFTDLVETPVKYDKDYLSPSRNFNVYTQITIGNRAVMGGLTTNGVQLVQRYLTIVAIQRLTDALINYQVRMKPTYNRGTANAVVNTLSEQLDKFWDSGWLEVTQVSETVTKVKDINGVPTSFTLLSKGEMLTNGYKVVVLPFSSADKKERVFRGIYVYLSTLTGIVKFIISGEAIR